MTKSESVIQGAFGRLFGVAIAKALDVLVLHRGHDLSLRELGEYAGVSTKTLSKTVLPKLMGLGLVKETRKIGHARMVTLNLSANPIADHLIACEFALSLEEVEQK